jgi:hypothetical protein
VLIDHLPPESATKTALRDAMPEVEEPVEPTSYGAWSQADLLLAAVADGINLLAWQQNQIHGGPRTPAPPPIPRPGVQRRIRRPSAEGRAYLEQIREQFRRMNGGER